MVQVQFLGKSGRVRHRVILNDGVCQRHVSQDLELLTLLFEIVSQWHDRRVFLALFQVESGHDA